MKFNKIKGKGVSENHYKKVRSGLPTMKHTNLLSAHVTTPGVRSRATERHRHVSTLFHGNLGITGRILIR